MTVPYDPEHITYIAETDYRNQRARFGIKSRDRTRHMYVIGKSGVGKSTLLENMAIQDISRGEGLAVLDPHGSFAEKMLDYIPEHRIKDVIYFAPFDTDYPISFNVLEDVGADKRHFVASGLMSTFKKIWVDAWSARMEYILNNILLALLEYPEATLLGVNRMLSDKAFRDKVVAVVTDPGVSAFWTDEFAKYGDRYMQEAGAAIQNKIGQFTANPLIRNIIGQPKSSFDIREAMDNQKILIVNLSKGRIGEQNTSLLGSMIITKIYLAAMSRADASPARMAELPNFYFYVDEFQSFANESFANILSEARKYKLALVIAHQYVAQMEESVRDAVFGNVGTSISFRVGPLDGELLEKVFSPQFTANDLVNLGMAQIYLSLLINDMGSSPFSARTLPPTPRPTITYRNDVIEISRQNFAAERELVVKNIMDWFGPAQAPAAEKPKKQFENPGAQFAQAQRPLSPELQQTLEQRTVAADGQALSPSTPPIAPISKTWTPKPRESASTQNQSHTPFKKAFTATPPIVQREEFPASTAPTRVFRPISRDTVQLKKPLPGAFIPTSTPPQKATPITDISPALTELLSSLDISEKKAPEEKTLRDSIPPVKLAERGPTEKNRDLLKAALLSAMGDIQSKAAAPIEPQQTIPVVAAPEISPVLTTTPPQSNPSTDSITSPQATSGQATTVTLQPEEIPYQELRKILE
ncbi:MAG: type IV secretion system DNA-binding domain-containing protein [Candidatus Paceibacterota bacterium]